MHDRRSNPRVNVHVDARIFLAGGIVLKCRTRDLSRGGVLIVFEKAEKLPARFGLRIGTSPDLREVEVAWRGTSELGARFVQA